MKPQRNTTRSSADADRKREMAAIHAGAASLGMDTADHNHASDYRTMLVAHGGATSSAAMDAAARQRVIAHLRRAGAFSKPAPKDGRQAELMRRLWRQLADAGALADPTERGLNAFVRRQTGMAAPRFLPATAANRVVEGLKAWLARVQAKT